MRAMTPAAWRAAPRSQSLPEIRRNWGSWKDEQLEDLLDIGEDDATKGGVAEFLRYSPFWVAISSGLAWFAGYPMKIIR
jgi:hypothetical protein